MNLIESLRKFDGKHTAALKQLDAVMPRNAESLAQLLAAAGKEDTILQVGATWILKRWHEEGTQQVESSTVKIITLLKVVTHWEARLHLLQILADLRIPARSSSVLAKLLPDLLVDENKLVRAWALTVLAASADQREALRKDGITLLRDAENDDAASVRARVRQIRKRYRWAT